MIEYNRVELGKAAKRKRICQRYIRKSIASERNITIFQ